MAGVGKFWREKVGAFDFGLSIRFKGVEEGERETGEEKGFGAGVWKYLSWASDSRQRIGGNLGLGRLVRLSLSLCSDG